jgi:hypothetical protein
VRQILPLSVTRVQFAGTDNQRLSVGTARASVFARIPRSPAETKTMTTETDAFVTLIKSCGYRVFMRKPSDKYCFYTDGERIGYAQWSDIRTVVSTVHKANRTTGTGFHVGDAITPDTLRDAIRCHTPNWARAGDAGTVKKYASWDAFHNESAFNSELREV